MKKHSPSARHAGLAILAGALTFMGSASAVTIFSENFEGVNAFGAPTYNYSQHYTLPNTLSPGGGNAYGTGPAGATATLTAVGSPFTLVTGGITGANIDAGQVTSNLTAQFSTYRDQNDYAQVRVTYFNAANAQLATQLIGGGPFVVALGSGTSEPPENLTGVRAWATDQSNSLVPVGARTATVDYLLTRLVGNAADGYLDNLSFSINRVPEPAVGLSAILGGSLLAARRRRRDAK